MRRYQLQRITAVGLVFFLVLHMIVMHYPPVRADGSPLKFEHRCINIESLIELAEKYGVQAIFTGHVHENYIYQLPGRSMYVINAGSGTFSKHSTYNIYTFEGSRLILDRREFNEELQTFGTFDRQTISFE